MRPSLEADRRGQRAFTPQAAARFYDRLGKRHDLAEIYESRAKYRALELLELEPGLRVLNAGVGTGKDQIAIAKAVGRAEMAVGLDISTVMLTLVRERAGSAVVRGDVLRLPFGDRAFDRILCAYLLDLIPAADLSAVLGEFNRTLRPGGRLVLVSLTEGVSRSSRLLIGCWKWLYGRNPSLVGGCRPLRLRQWLETAGFEVWTDDVVVQHAVPSEVVAAGLRREK